MTAPVALITGASSGIGRETALQLAAKGWRLALTARREDRLKELAAAIQAAGGPAPLILPGDIAQPGAAAARVEKTAAHFGRLDVLINNAGILRMSNFLQMPLSEMRDVFETN
ncbi:MAG TPA: SDR family NAD(P)-dependent oxidoreductase, partial [Elusimicrobiota bacterium]|nr:SDR family NAD(P)-dependent oxidoreductase [Elusimicrobiota bacterium]